MFACVVLLDACETRRLCSGGIQDLTTGCKVPLLRIDPPASAVFDERQEKTERLGILCGPGDFLQVYYKVCYYENKIPAEPS